MAGSLATVGSNGGSASKQPKKRNVYAIACTVFASMTSILIGYDGGVMSGAQEPIQKVLHVSDVEIEIVSGGINIFSLVGAALAGRTSDWLGRRWTIVLAGVIFFVGSLAMGLASNYWWLMFGRFLGGVGTGYALMIAPVYSAEVAPTSARGFLTSLPEVFINFGVLLGYISNYGFSKLPLWIGWRLMLGIGAVPSVMVALFVIFMPESPRWLVMQGRLKEAKTVLYKTSDSDEEAESRLADIKEAAGIPFECNDDIVHVEKKKSSGQGVWRELFLHPSPAVLHILIAAVGIQFFQQASGVDTVVLYSPRIFEKAGIKSTDKKLLATMAVGFSKTVCVLISVFFVDKVGRRKILLSSVAGMVISLATLASTLFVINNNTGEQKTWPAIVCIIMVITFVGSFSMGLGPIAWVYCSEIFPLRLRAQGTSIGVAMNRLMSGVNSMSFISLYKAITISGAFYLYTGIAAISWVFFYVMLPETQGRTLEDMEVLFGRFHRWRSAAKELEKGTMNAENDGGNGTGARP